MSKLNKLSLSPANSPQASHAHSQNLRSTIASVFYLAQLRQSTRVFPFGLFSASKISLFSRTHLCKLIERYIRAPLSGITRLEQIRRRVSWRFNFNLGVGKIKRHQGIQPQDLYKTVGAFERLSRDALIHIYLLKAFFLFLNWLWQIIFVLRTKWYQ